MEKIESINERLRDLYGIDTLLGIPIFRVVWAPDQLEKRMTDRTDSGIMLLEPEVRELPKYQWITDAYVLERLVLVPDENQKELAGLKISYEPLWVFIGADDFPVPPTTRGCQFVVDALYAGLGKKSMAKYKEDIPAIKNEQENYEYRKKELDELQNQLFGDESGLKQQTIGASGSGIIVPANYNKGVH